VKAALTPWCAAAGSVMPMAGTSPSQQEGLGLVVVDPRHVYCPAEESSTFEVNYVQTARYNKWNFLPKNLLLQFHRFVNCFFLTVSILASISSISPIGPLTFWLPIGLLLFTTMVKDAYEDYQRHKADTEENARVTEVFNPGLGDFMQMHWKDVTVGSIVRVSTTNSDTSPMIPADLTLLASSTKTGTAFLETANLDGESNLKLRESPAETHHLLTTFQEGAAHGALNKANVRKLALKVVCNPPDAFLYDFHARMEIEGQEIPLGGGHLLQRSTKLRNTKWVVGVAVYTGRETKIQMNMSDPPNKITGIERQLNRFMLYLFWGLMAMSLIGGIGSTIMVVSPETGSGAWYLAPEDKTATFDANVPGVVTLLSFFAFVILLCLFIPISLYVTLEFVKLFLATAIWGDREMWAAEEDMRTLPRTMGLCEELGQINYIFSDKTGTLTQNLMEFRKCSIAGVVYGRGHCEVERAIARLKGQRLPPNPPAHDGVDKGFNFVDERLVAGSWQGSPQEGNIQMFLTHLALNHTVQVGYASGDAESAGTDPQYQAESQDEWALVHCARNLGVFFQRRDEAHNVELRVAQQGDPVGAGATEVWQVLNVNMFDNIRKRTSVVVSNSAGDLLLLVKGADSSVLPFVEQDASFAPTEQHIAEFSNQGLRTLVLAGRALDPEEYADWNKRYQRVALQASDRDEAMRMLASEIEESHSEPGKRSALVDGSTPTRRRLRLHGVTALEDKLQERVGECIAQLAKAMIKIWLLTGDKLETAVNIGYATALLKTEMEPLLRVCHEDMVKTCSQYRTISGVEHCLTGALERATAGDLAGLEAVCQQGRNLVGGELLLGALCDRLARLRVRQGQGTADTVETNTEIVLIESRLREALLKERVRQRILELCEVTSVERPGGWALVIDGPCLRAAMHPDLRLHFLQVGLRCKAVLCARVTPSQKAQVLLLVKENLTDQVTLAIGDGANDVSMIQAAHVGVGIRGKEGQQAVLASDYALPRFAFLERLLLVHGRWDYNRIGTMVCYFFYKCNVMSLTLLWYAFDNAFSSQPLYDDGYQALYNVIFTALPNMIFAILDRDLEADILRAHPELYSTGQASLMFSARRFGVFVGGSIVHSAMLYYLTLLCIDRNVGSEDGKPFGMWSMGTITMTNVIMVASVVMVLLTKSWCFLHWGIYSISVLYWFLFMYVYHALWPGLLGNGIDETDGVYSVFSKISPAWPYWMAMVVVTAACCLPVLCYIYVKEHYYPNIGDFYRRVVAQPHLYPNESVSPPIPAFQALATTAQAAAAALRFLTFEDPPARCRYISNLAGRRVGHRLKRAPTVCRLRLFRGLHDIG